jgi:hypothetical protein
MTNRALSIVSLALLAACSGEDSPSQEVQALWHCEYTGGFSDQEVCREYHGPGWVEAGARTECDEQGGVLAAGSCAEPATLGTCVIPAGEAQWIHVIGAGDDTATCSTLKQVCETFENGDFVIAPTCEGKTDDPPPQLEDPTAELVCRDPLPGEPPGLAQDGKVCTWQALAGCTEPGRNFADYVSCGPLYPVRGYYPAPPAPEAEPDPRMQDPDYAATLAWVKQQIEACSCVCCHQSSKTPQGAVIWDTELDGNFVNSFSPWGLAFMAGFADSSILGAIPAAENNGFARDVTGTPTTDVDRLVEFFAAELERRGYSPEDFTK